MSAGATSVGSVPVHDPTTRWSTAALAAAAVTEVLVLRTATRTFIHIPGLGEYEQPLGLIAQVGRAAYYLAAVLVVVVLVATAIEHLGRTQHWSVAGAVGLFLAMAVGLRLGVVGDLVAAAAVLAVAAAMSVFLWLTPLTRRDRQPLAMFVAAFLLAGVHAVAQFASMAGIDVPRTAWLLVLAEPVAVIGALLTPRIVERIDRRAAGIGALTTVAVFGGLTSSGASLRILMLWNVGLGGWLPDIVYAAAAGALVYSTVATVRAGRTRWAVAIVLLTCGGIGLHSTYQSGLVLVALLTLAAGRTQGQREPAVEGLCAAA